MLEDQQESHVEVWPDNWEVVGVFIDMLTQWNVGGMGGLIGLRYEALQLVFELRGTKRKRRREIFDGLRIMERAVMTEVNKDKNGQ